MRTVKKYITEYDDLKEALLKRMKVYREGWNESHHFRVVNGVFCVYENDKMTYYGAEVYLSSDEGDRLYYYVEEPIKLQSGRLYKTRDGRQAYVCHHDWQDTFYGCIRNWGQIVKWSEDGITEDTAHNVDIVSEWGE